MRKDYDSQLQLDSIPIASVVIDLRSRDELPQLLLGLQYIFKNASLRDSILAILKEDVLADKNHTGRPGMSLWELFVLGSCRLNLNIDYDRLHGIGASKCIAYIKLLRSVVSVSGLRNYKSLRRVIKKCYTLTARIHKRKGANYVNRLQDATEKYLACIAPLLKKVNSLVSVLSETVDPESPLQSKLDSLKYYRDMLKKHIDLVDRRILQGEQIPHSEKVFSIFEPETEWLNKGKEHPSVELGHNVMIATDQFHFIVSHKVAVKTPDKDLVIALGQDLKKRFAENYKLYSISFDKGFWLKLNKQAMEKIFEIVVMPKKGKPNIAEQEEYQTDSYKTYKRKHSAVESNINELEQGGLDKVRDKGLNGFKKYVAWAVVAYNLKRLGKLCLEQRRAKVQRLQKAKKRQFKKAS